MISLRHMSHMLGLWRISEFNFSNVNHKVQKCVYTIATRRSQVLQPSLNASAVFTCWEVKEEAESVISTWSTHIRSQPLEPFPLAHFCTKLRSKGFMPEIKIAFSPNKRIRAKHIIKIKKGHAMYHPEMQ